MENTAPSLDLFTLLEIALEERNEAAEAFDIFKQDAVMAHAPEAGQEPAVTSDIILHGAVRDIAWCRSRPHPQFGSETALPECPA